MLKVGQTVKTDEGAYYTVQRVLQDGWALAESWGHKAKVYVRETGRRFRRIPGGGYGYRVALHRAVDIGLATFEDVIETLQPEPEPVGGGFVYA